MRTCLLSITVRLCVLLLLVSAPESMPAGDRVLLKRITAPVHLDGFLDEPVWDDFTPIPLVMRFPSFQADPSERSEILIGYDDDYLYIAGRLYDSNPEKIQSTARKRDDWKTSLDQLGIILDTFNDNENGVAFIVTPSGMRIDAAIKNDGKNAPSANVNLDWNAFWDAAVQRNDQGWFVEMRIPFSSLRFQEFNDRVMMGLTVFRYIPRKQEWDIFPAIDPSHGGWGFLKVSQAYDAVIEGIQAGNPLYIAPYVLGGLGDQAVLSDDAASYVRDHTPLFDLGLDIKYGITSNLTFDITLNTDFAQVEADDQQVNLSRFSLFYPEKRLFFQERSSNFEFNFEQSNRLFYSRRIGMYQGKPVRIYGGGRIVGRTGPWDIGFLSMQTEAPERTLSSENFSLVRLRRQVINSRTYVGGIVTNRIDLDGKYNTAFGLDGIFHLYGEDYLTIRGAGTFDSQISGNSDPTDKSRLYLNWERRTVKGIGYSTAFSRAGKAYNPGMGYEQRSDYSRIGIMVWNGWIPRTQSSLRNHDIFLDGFLFSRNRDGSVESSEWGTGWFFEMKSGYSGQVLIKMIYEDVQEHFQLAEDVHVPQGKYTFHDIDLQFSMPSGGLFNLAQRVKIGSFYDGTSLLWQLLPRWNMSTNLELSGMYQLNRVRFDDRDQQMLTHVARLKGMMMFHRSLSVSAFIQYNSLADIIIANVRLRYNPREGADLYLVYDEGFNTERSRSYPVLPVTKNRTVLLKYTYTFTY